VYTFALVGETMNATGLSTFYVKVIVYNSPYLVFHSTGTNTTINGSATNMNGISWNETYPDASKLKVNVLHSM
jgi:hypothetical protein